MLLFRQVDGMVFYSGGPGLPRARGLAGRKVLLRHHCSAAVGSPAWASRATSGRCTSVLTPGEPAFQHWAAPTYPTWAPLLLACARR